MTRVKLAATNEPEGTGTGRGERYSRHSHPGVGWGCWRPSSGRQEVGEPSASETLRGRDAALGEWGQGLSGGPSQLVDDGQVWATAARDHGPGSTEKCRSPVPGPRPHMRIQEALDGAQEGACQPALKRRSLHGRDTHTTHTPTDPNTAPGGHIGPQRGAWTTSCSVPCVHV